MGNAYRSVLELKPTGNAIPANVLAGKTFSNADGTGKTGTMVNNGAISVTLTDQDPTYTIPEGYHNGGGEVTFISSGGDGADLIVTCSSNFAGSVITCTNGSSYTKTQTCPSSSPYEVTFESIPTGTYTISGVVSGTTFTTTKTILDFDAALTDIPDGSTVTPTDDIQIWLHCANIWDKAYTTISQVLADTSTLQALIASNNAADYMARSTTWSSDVTSNQSAMSYIGLNNYCSNALLDNSTWRTSICNSTYFESVLNTKVPTMTSNTTPSGTCFASSKYDDTYDAWKAFNKAIVNQNYWCSYGNQAKNQYVGYQFSESVKIYRIDLTNMSNNAAKNCKIQYSSDGNTYSDACDFINPSTGSAVTTEIVNNTDNVPYWRLFVTDGYTTEYIYVAELQFYGRSDV